ncbi:MAG: DUF3619 family protein [Burkholderiaceae bacterium]|nr:DUF3619 family protein [Burkholderiaceae bacterium]
MNEREFAYRIRQALNEGTDRLPYRVVVRLERARSTALARKKTEQGGPLQLRVPSLRLAGAGSGFGSLDRPNVAWIGLRLVSLLVPVIAIAVGFAGISKWRQEQAIAEHANMDLAVLLDDTPIETYADKGFGVLIREQQNDGQQGI